jgi:chemotaxis family two-component system sensor kinase Cph1
MNVSNSSVPVPPWENGAYSIKRHGVTISNCDSEPVQTPGCIQSHGALLVLRAEDFTVIQASENLDEHFGIRAEEALGKPLSSLLGEEGEQRLRDFIAKERTERNPLYAFTVSLAGDYDLIVHTSEELVILEAEPAAPAESPLPDYYGIVKKAVTRLHEAHSLQGFCDVLAEEVRGLTGIDRVMVYHFHEDFHGEVVAEAKREDMAPWLGLHYPAEDIPWPAREIFKKIWVRPLPDAAAPVMELVPLANPDTGKPLLMTHCVLRGASVMYTEYLRNMGVAASLTMSLMVDGELWGLIACQHETPRRFPHQIRAACEFMAQVASLHLRAVEQRESLGYRLKIEEVHNRVITNAAQDADLGPLTSASPNLLDTLDAGGVAVFHGDRWWKTGSTPTDTQLDSLKDWLLMRPEFESPVRPIYATDSLVRDFPSAAGFATVGSGLLALTLSRRRHTFVLWFRPETIQTVNWGGNPHDKPVVTGPHGPRLTPRRSFEIFTESVKHRSLPWKRVEVEAALRLRVLIMELVVSRTEEITVMNAELMRSNEELDAFAYVASHDLKEPLRGISKYAHQLIETEAHRGEETLRRLESMKRLALRMDSLLDSLLHFSRVGRATLSPRPVDLQEVLEEALEIIAPRLQEVPTRVEIPQRLPVMECDRMRVREVFMNLLSNALKYNDKAEREIEIGFAELPDGGTVFHVKDNGIGMDPRHFDVVFKIFKRLHDREAFGGGSGAGLAIVRRLIEQHRGRIWVNSSPGVGSTFFFTLAESPLALE